MKDTTVLIIDDEPFSIKILSHQLQNEYTIIEARGGAEALAIISDIRPDIILLDVVMPEMNGYEVFSAIRKITSLDDIPVLFITYLEGSDREAEGLEMGAGDYIHKPFNPDLVRLRIRNHLQFSQQKRQLSQQNAELHSLNAELEREIVQKNATQSANEELIKKLETALAKVKMLEGIIPICSYCHKIRDDQNIWKRLDQYIHEYSDAQLSHGICPDCVKEQMLIIDGMKK
jgi:PleD family two-component response regulator